MMKETSELLQRTRLSKNLSLEEISSQTKIQLHILKCLDEGNIDGLPNKIYAKGFLRQYAQALGLKVSDVIDLFEKESSTAETSSTKPTPISRLDNNQLQEKTNVLWFRAPAKFISFAGVIIIILLIGSIYFFSMKYASYSKETLSPTSNISSEPASAADTPQLESLINQNDPSLALPKPSDTTPESSTPAGDKAAVEDTKPKIVSIEAKDTVTIEASWSTGKKELVKLRANSRHVFYYAKKIKLIVSDGGIVKITANEKELEPGEVGKPVTLNFE